MTDTNSDKKVVKINDNLSKEKKYDFEKKCFIVYPVFKENKGDTLGEVLLRLIKSEC